MKRYNSEILYSVFTGAILIWTDNKTGRFPDPATVVQFIKNGEIASLFEKFGSIFKIPFHGSVNDPEYIRTRKSYYKLYNAISKKVIFSLSIPKATKGWAEDQFNP